MKLFLLFIFISSLLQANMGAVLIIPRDAKFVMGVYTGVSQASTTTEIESTNSAIDGKKLNYDNNVALLGAIIGLQNNYYRFSFSYDVNNDQDLELQRALMNFDFMIGEKEGFRSMLGFGVGVAMSSYDINSKNIKQDNGLVAFRVGTEYIINESKSIEILLEYAYLITNSIGKSFYEGTDFTTYNIKNRNDIILRIGYNFEF